jgi:hypothetical protein
MSVSNEGAIYSRRMVRDCEKANKNRKIRKKGGNPDVKEGVDPRG